MITEKVITIETTEPINFFGIKHANIQLIENAFPQLKIVVRGDSIKAMGDENSVLEFENLMTDLISHFNRYGILKAGDISNLLFAVNNGSTPINGLAKEPERDSEVLVYGKSGRLIKARTPNQRLLVSSNSTNDIVFAIGPAGTGKTYTAVALAVRALINKEVRRIILTRPAVEAGENLGFLPGDLRDKLDPYLQPLYDALGDMIPQPKLGKLFEEKVIEIAPLAFMRGRTLDHAFVILDEAQNTTSSQLKMFLTRMGKDAKFIITGDITQIDLPRNQSSGLIEAQKILSDIEGISFVILDEQDIVRHN